MTGCGCLMVVIGIVGMLWIFIRGSFDAGEPIEQAAALLIVFSAAEWWLRKGAAGELVRARRA